MVSYLDTNPVRIYFFLLTEKIRQTEKFVMMQCFSGCFSRVTHHRISV